MRSILSNLNQSLTKVALMEAIYGPDGRLSSNFLLRTKDTLASMAGLPDELHRQFPLDLNSKRVGVSRLSAHIHLLFHQVRSSPLGLSASCNIY